LDLDWNNIVAGLIGGGGGTATIILLVKFIVNKYVKDNEEKHSRHERATKEIVVAMRELNKKMSNIKIDIEVIKNSMSSVIKIHDDVVRHEKELAVALERISGCKEDIDKGFASIRGQLSKLKTVETKETPASEAKKLWQSKTVWASAVAAAMPLVYAPAATWIAANPETYSMLLAGVFTLLRLVTKDKVSIK
jgi:hypothetical protein